MISVLSFEGRYHKCLSHTSALIRKINILYFENKHFTSVKSLKNRLNTDELTKTN